MGFEDGLDFGGGGMVSCALLRGRSLWITMLKEASGALGVL